MAIKNFGKGTVKFNEGIVVSGTMPLPTVYISGSLQIEASGNEGMFFTDVGNKRIGIGTTIPTEQLHVSNSAGNSVIRIESVPGSYAALNLKGGSAPSAWSWQPANSNEVRFYTNGDDRMAIDGDGNVGIGTTDPRAPLDVHVPSGFLSALTDDQGGGHVVTWGTEDTTDTLAAGKLMYMASDGKWKYADADAVASSGGVLLGIALGSAVSDGVLLRGYFDAATIQGSFVKGGACYISENAGVIDFTAPSTAGDIVRIVGYGTDTANVIYFDPSSTWIEL